MKKKVTVTLSNTHSRPETVEGKALAVQSDFKIFAAASLSA